MSNPFARSIMMGYKPEQILNFLGSSDPKMAKKIAQATGLGYTVPQILNFLGLNGTNKKQSDSKRYAEEWFSANDMMSRAFGGGVDSIRQLQEQATQSDGPQRKQARETLGKIGKGALGALALASGAGLLGGSAAAAGVGAAGAAEGAAAAGAARGGLGAIGSALGGSRASGIAQGLASALGATGNEDGVTRDQVFATINDYGIGDLFTERGVKAKSPQSLLKSLNKTLGTDWLTAISKKLGIGPNEVISKGYAYLQEGPEEQLPQGTAQEPEVMQQPEMAQQPQAQAAAPEELFEGEVIEQPPQPLTGRDLKPVERMRSSNLSQVAYDPEAKRLQVAFRPSGQAKGALYEYEGVDPNDITAFMQGQGAAKTTGANAFGSWFSTKDPSIGAAFNNFIKRKNDEGQEVYDYRQIDPLEALDPSLLSARDADAVQKVTQYVDAFSDLGARKLAKDRKAALQATNTALKGIPDEQLESVLTRLEKAYRNLEKQAKAKGKKKRFAGGREKSLLQKAEEYLSRMTR